MTPRHPRPAVPGTRTQALLVLVLVLGACVQLPRPSLPFVTTAQPGLTREELHAQLADYAARFAAVVGATAEDITEQVRDRQVRKRALLWRVRVVPLVQRAAFEGDPQASFVSVMTVVVMMRQFLTEGEGRAAFAPVQELAVGAALELENDLLRIGDRFLDAEQMGRLRAEVEDLARQSPIRGGFAVPVVQAALIEAQQSQRFQWLVDVPLAPFRALEGVGSGAQAIHDFNETAREFTTIVAQLPEQIRGEIELLLYDVEDRETVLSSLSALETLAASADRFSEAVERLPEELRSSAPEVRALLAEAERVVAQVREVAEPLAMTAEQVNLAGSSWGALLQREPGAEHPGRPFDIREWEATARQIGAAAVELRALASELSGLAGESRGDTALAAANAVVERTRSEAQQLVDYIAWRILLLIVVFFALLLVQRALGARLARR